MDTKQVTFKFDTITKGKVRKYLTTRASLLIGGYKLQYCVASDSSYNFIDTCKFIDIWHSDVINENIFGLSTLMLSTPKIYNIGGKSKECVVTCESAYAATCEFASYISPNTHEPVPEKLVDFLYRLIIAIVTEKEIEITANKEMVANG